MQTNRPPTPPGFPTIAQRVSAIQLASKAHSSPKGKILARGQALVLPVRNDHPKTPIPSMITYPNYVDEMDERRFSKSARPRFMRWKNKDKYPRKEENTK
jgi:hypothetical protein